jgi:hypothetical protein
MFDGDGMVEHPVQDGGGDDRVAEDLPQLPKLWLLVRIMGPRSEQRLMSWKNKLALARSMGR